MPEDVTAIFTVCGSLFISKIWEAWPEGLCTPLIIMMAAGLNTDRCERYPAYPVGYREQVGVFERIKSLRPQNRCIWTVVGEGGERALAGQRGIVSHGCREEARDDKACSQQR